MINKKNILAIFFVLSCGLFASPVHAQIESPTMAPDLVYETESLSAELHRLKTQYRGELDEYRQLQNTYVVAKKQYEQLGTLASLEDGVRATQAAMESRARVLKTYLQIVKVSLLEQTGVEVDQKQAALTEVDRVISELDKDYEQFGKELDRVALKKISDKFVEFDVVIQDVSYRVLSLLAVGELQTIYDKAVILADDMESELATQGGALKQSQRQRSFDETHRQLEQITPKLKREHQRIKDPRSSNYQSVYNISTRELGNVYADISKALSFLKELLKS